MKSAAAVLALSVAVVSSLPTGGRAFLPPSSPSSPAAARHSANSFGLRARPGAPSTSTPADEAEAEEAPRSPPRKGEGKRAALVARAAALDLGRESYAPSGWSNRHGSVLAPAALPGVYVADRPFIWNGIDVGGRMTVIQLQSSASDGRTELAVHSPVGLDPPLIAALEKLGTVAHVISPNYEHVKYASEWAERYPDARVWGCPGLAEREPDVRWTGEVPFGARPAGFPGTTTAATKADGMWDWEELRPLHLDTEVNPFTGTSFFNEVLFYHAPSKTLLTTDFYVNYPRGDGVTNGQVVDELGEEALRVDDGEDEDEGDFGTWELAPDVGRIPLADRLWGKVGMDKLFYPFYMNFMVRRDRRDDFDAIGRFVCGGGGDGNGWEVETIVPCHGDIVRGRGLCRRVLEAHFNDWRGGSERS